MEMLAPRAASGLFQGWRAIEREQWRAFRNWALVWLILANAGFAIMWAIGAPPRAGEIIAIGAIGLIVRNRPFMVQLGGFVIAVLYALLSFIAGLFNLAITSLISSIRFFLEIDPLQSIEYVVGGVFVLAFMGVAVRMMRLPQHFADNRIVVLATASVLGLAALDTSLGMGMRGHYKRNAVEGTPFSSAIEMSGFASANTSDRHLLLVMVESLGEPVNNPEMSRLLFQRYMSDAVRERFELRRGTTTYFNSTTAAEIRELCSRWGDYFDFLDRPDPTCLPARLRARGYETLAVHSFISDFFDRAQWYPHLGFEEQAFAQDLVDAGARECGGVFPGACDRDIPRLLARRIRNAENPQFIYWLTLNSHLPVPPDFNLDVDNCETVSAMLAEEFPMICRQFAIWDAVDAALVNQITDPEFPPTDILIVGDHMPPYFDRHHRSQFAPDRVPWLLLRWKDQDMAVAAAQKAAS